jgi:MHS family proline/betaine transporter-like MFS transporter
MPIKTWTLWLLDFADHFDLYIYACLSPVIGALFFPSTPLVEIILAYGVFWASSVIAYPLGTTVFGFLAGRFSPEVALRWAALGLSLFTCIIGMLPPYSVWGIGAPILLLAARSFQYTFACGERMITRLYIVKDKSVSHAVSFSVTYDVFSVLGLLCASIAATIILWVKSQHLWRLPFLIAGALSFLAFIYRRPFEKISLEKKEFPPLKISLSLVLECIAVSGFSYVPYALVFQFLNGFIPQISSVDHAGMMLKNTYLLGIDLGILILFGITLRRIQKPQALAILMIIAASILLVTGLPLFLLIPKLLEWNALFIFQLWFIIWGILYAIPLMAWLRYFGISSYQYFYLGVGLALGQVLIGHSTTFFCFLLYKITGWIGAPGFYLFFSCALALWGQRRLLKRFNHHTVVSGHNMRG